MRDDLVKRWRNTAVHSYLGRSVIEEAADRIEALTAERDMALAEWDDCVERNRPRSAADTTAMTDLIAEIEFEAVNGEVDRHLAGRIITAMRALTAERDHAWSMVAKADTQVGQSLADHMQAKAERDRLRALLSEADRRIVWEAVGFGNDFADQVQSALKGETP